MESDMIELQELIKICGHPPEMDASNSVKSEWAKKFLEQRRLREAKKQHLEYKKKFEVAMIRAKNKRMKRLDG